jgi:DNA-binding response OmpR family regulator
MGKVLIVDDNIDILTVVQLILSFHGFAVKGISKWEEIFDEVENFKPDVILLDIALSGNDGRVLCQQIKSTQSGKNKPIIILFSAHHNLQNNYGQYMADDFISKPFDSNVLVNKLRYHSSAIN